MPVCRDLLVRCDCGPVEGQLVLAVAPMAHSNAALAVGIEVVPDRLLIPARTPVVVRQLQDGRGLGALRLARASHCRDLAAAGSACALSSAPPSAPGAALAAASSRSS